MSNTKGANLPRTTDETCKGNHHGVSVRKPVEICNHCGRSVSLGSGLFVNRVPDLNDIETRIANNLKYVEGDFVCRECDEKTSDDEYGYSEDIDA